MQSCFMGCQQRRNQRTHRGHPYGHIISVSQPVFIFQRVPDTGLFSVTALSKKIPTQAHHHRPPSLPADHKRWPYPFLTAGQLLHTAAPTTRPRAPESPRHVFFLDGRTCIINKGSRVWSDAVVRLSTLLSPYLKFWTVVDHQFLKKAIRFQTDS